MAILKQSVIGVLSGKIGQVVGATWKGISILKVLPAKVANPKTDKQLDQRQRFAVTMAFLQPMSKFLRVSWGSFAVKMTAINAAMSYIIKNALQGTYPNIAVDYPNALVAKGSLPPALNATAASTVAATVAFTWLDNSTEAGASDTDKTLIVIYSPAKKQAVTAMGLQERLANSQAVTVPSSFSGDLVHCYIAFETLDGSEQSNSMYAGAVTVA